MKIEKIENEGETVLLLDGRLDATASLVAAKATLDVIETGKNVVLDFARVSYVSSGGLRAILVGHKAAKARNLSMTVRSLTDEVRRVLRMTGFDSIFAIDE